jgi:hypothetical protein
VLWPSPIDNTTVLKPGSYTITGRVAGTDFQPKAIGHHKRCKKIGYTSLKLEAFDLNQVALKTDAHGHETKFVENRDKFIRTLATTDPELFSLYVPSRIWPETT